tara:strand:- start:965 stop:1087 length:123 start_codon:yes stop_codon:yes gene_type:complete
MEDGCLVGVTDELVGAAELFDGLGVELEAGEELLVGEGEG